MFNLNECFEVDRGILKSGHTKYSPAETSSIITPNNQTNINLPREDSVISFLKSCLELSFEVTKKADNSRYGNGKDIRFVSLGPNVLFSSLKLTTSSGKLLEDISLAHIVSLMYKLSTSTRGNDDLSSGFDRDRE